MANNNRKQPLALILGSGFSTEAGLPTTEKLAERFLDTPSGGVLSPELELEVSKILESFWNEVFGYCCGQRPPSLEDHFTVLDLAANSGHNPGRGYSPRKLRAIRRMSIHRVFQILDLKDRSGGKIQNFLSTLCEHFDLSIISLNWDIVVENLLERQGIRYGIEVDPLPDTFEKDNGILLLKVHGSSNWIYCDCCRRLYAGAREKSALHKKAFLEKDDFVLFGISDETIRDGLGNTNDRNCPHRRNIMAGRVATFSYRKAFSINQFQTIWDYAHKVLHDADTWLFVGYSMPQADFEFRHHLKSAQLGRDSPERWRCEVLLKQGEEAGNRYKSFFGLPDNTIWQEGLSSWVNCRLRSFCRHHGTEE